VLAVGDNKLHMQDDEVASSEVAEDEDAERREGVMWISVE